MQVEVEIVSRKLVGPRTPTPASLRNYKISFMDELNPTMNVPMILTYPSTPSISITRLEHSLSQILTQFYPFAGRYLKKDHVVDCNDQGAQFTLAKIDVRLRQLIDPDSQVVPEQLNDLLPCEIGEADEETDPILFVQVTRFTCGGIAIGICISHRVVDVCSLGTFISAWSSASREGHTQAVRPSFDGPLYFPPKNFSAPEFGTTRIRVNTLGDIVCKRFTFDRDAISRMRTRVGITGELGRLSRVALVTGLIAKAIAGVDEARNVAPRAFLVAQAVNMRERTVPSLSKHSIGNLVDLAISECSADEARNMGFEDFVLVLGNDAKKTVNNCARVLSEGEKGQKYMIDTSIEASKKTLQEDRVNVVWFTDVTKFRFYEADFGWGKPIWASVPNVVIKNHVVLMTTKGGDGIEAWVQLPQADMVYFQQDEQLGKFTSPAHAWSFVASRM